MADFTFNGQLEWTIDSQSMATDIDAAAIQSAILTTRAEWSEEEKLTITAMSYLLSCTRSVKLVGSKKHTNQLTQFVEGINSHPNAEQLFNWRSNIPYKLYNAWQDAFQAAQDIFEVDPAQLPSSALTPAQQEELKNKNSPLAKTG